MTDHRRKVLGLLSRVKLFSAEQFEEPLFHLFASVSHVDCNSRYSDVGLSLDPQLEVLVLVRIDQILYVWLALLSSRVPALIERIFPNPSWFQLVQVALVVLRFVVDGLGNDILHRLVHDGVVKTLDCGVHVYRLCLEDSLLHLSEEGHFLLSLNLSCFL